MLHEIAPHKLHNEFRTQLPKPDDCVILFDGEKSLLKKQGESFVIPRIKDFGESPLPCHYLFCVDDVGYFLAEPAFAEAMARSVPAGFEFKPVRTFRYMESPLERLGGATAAHIAKWESLNRFCGRCGCATVRGERERSINCPKCGNVVYPKISPVVIVAVHNGDELLMARNLDNPDKSRLFLISGFVEVGENLEQAVHREVLEEAGVHVKNVRYFGSQPWPFSESLIAGFTAELDGDPTLRVQESELATAAWVKREDIPPYDTSVSISSCLIENFRHV
ncbi:NAD(+) diphosphatase [Fibrobacter sp. UBA4309]|uniref:NAD(+) diphosphatase n=1 Tax=Fibrobacter sp. UBA4309 TaxID=1946537 RepID=UPI0025BED2CA|nr:NAD(+) diphosphatase [Fibrobacter sp. UBA4309]